jgi:myxalamid-type nonribosomal peptide synthetase MxaA
MMDNLSEAKRRLLEQRLKGGRSTAQVQSSIASRPGEIPPYLSYAQERLWFLAQLHPDSSAYNMHEAVRLSGLLDLTALQDSFRAVIRRHDILRTRFVRAGDDLVQIIDAAMELPVELVDACHLPSEDREAFLHQYARQEAQHHFDLQNGPLLRLSIVRLDKEEHVLFFTIHHILSDEWSNKVFWQELGQFYQAYHHKSDEDLPQLPLQYSDYAYDQRQRFESGGMQKQLDYWKRTLGSQLPVLQLPTDHPRPGAQSFQGALLSRNIPLHILEALRTLSRQTETTLFMSLLAVFEVLLYRYSGQPDLMIGIPVANRERPEVSKMMGLFLNTLVLRADLNDEPSFREMLNRVRQAVLDALANQELPFEKMVEAIQPERDFRYNPLFQVMFVYQNDPWQNLVLPGLKSTPFLVDGGVSKFDLTLFAIETSNGLEVFFEYSTDLFEASTIERMLLHYQTLLEAVVGNPEIPVDRLPLLSEIEQRQILIKWNETEQPVADVACIHELIEARVDQTPLAVALQSRTGQITYGELETRSNQLAQYLRKRGVQPGVLVGLCVERSHEMIISMLGILKAGGAYVPLDPSYPKERLSSILTDAQIKLIVTQAKLVEKLPDGDIPQIVYENCQAELARQPDQRPTRLANENDLAYIIYTSGSTGKPKGVPVSHRNLIYSTEARRFVYPHSIERFLLLSSFSFDSSVAGIYGSLCQGGTLCLPDQREEQDVYSIAGLIQEWRITDMLCLPSLYALLLVEGGPELLASLQTVIVAGEACPMPLIKQHYQRLPKADLYNEYGPTEGTVWSSVYCISSDFQGHVVPIGKPVPNMKTYVLDKHLQPVPVGAVGELYIAGEGLVSGYYNRPELTAERFLVTSMMGIPVRLYRTGDLARYRPDGNLEFLGRVDFQVKVRGYRIELEEIEAALLQHQNVREVVVLARHETIGANDANTDVEALVKQLSALEPDLAESLLDELDALGEFETQRMLEESRR